MSSTDTVVDPEWPQKRKEYQERFDRLATEQNNASLDDYYTLYNEIKDHLIAKSSGPTLNALLEETSELKRVNNKIYKELDKNKIDVDSAVARNELLRSRESNLTSHKLFLLNRPIRRNRLPYLWVLGVLFIGVALCIFNVMSPSLPFSIQSTDGIVPTLMTSLLALGQTVTGFFTNPYVITSLITAIICVIIGIILKNNGKI
jgi:hypothetical protein